ncbi:Nn.00g084310.m01.CDS01 [Neocucurbitaria sp. VM-36]
MLHHATPEHMFRQVTVPDSQPAPSVLLVEGDLNTAFNCQDGNSDIIVTHFFIDTARSFMAYFDTIHRLLNPGSK